MNLRWAKDVLDVPVFEESQSGADPVGNIATREFHLEI